MPRSIQPIAGLVLFAALVLGCNSNESEEATLTAVVDGETFRADRVRATALDGDLNITGYVDGGAMRERP